MPFAGPADLEKEMRNDHKERLANRRADLEKSYSRNLRRLQARLDEVDGAGDVNHDVPTSDVQLQAYLDELANLITAKKEIEGKILKTTEDIALAAKGFEQEFIAVLEGVKQDIAEAMEDLYKIDGSAMKVNEKGQDDGKRP
ncbi:uncharacterized protein AB675_3374 [Cyphellophora attinorum]|uniref:Uncharacterized protein n=1 Tax=Cyphellophora attinorum TaxID=1664694 RepID=A0A0N1H3M5_9EURO|nr:uncharacterized protein AB675_3374 [Phialophora attinorum]KPI39526.1 hypothetical protein AB675_3374 [Phialophora attinorum]